MKTYNRAAPDGDKFNDDPELWFDRCSHWCMQSKEAMPARRKLRRKTRHPLMLTGHGVRLHIDHGALVVRDGFTHYLQKAHEQRFFPGGMDMPSRILVIDGSGSLSFDVMAWLAEQGVPLVRIDWRGEIATLLGGSVYRADSKRVACQLEAQESDRKIAIATDVIRAKIANSIETLAWPYRSHPLSHFL